MNSRERKLLSQQLRTQATAFEHQDENVNLVLPVVNSCTAMLRAVMKDDAFAADINADDFDMVFTQFVALESLLERFFDHSSDRFQKESLSDGHRELIHKLTQKRDSAEKMRNELETVKKNIGSAEQEITDFTSRVEEGKSTLLQLQQKRDGLLQLMEDCSDEKITSLQNEINELRSTFTENNQIVEPLRAEHTRLTSNIASVDREIRELPSENSNLVASLDAKKLLLERLRNAQKECGPEVQNKLQDEIDRLSPIVEENKSAVDVLKEHLDDLKTQNTSYDRERESLSTNVLDLLDASMAELRAALNDHEGRMKNIQRDAEDYRKRLDECFSLREQYDNWLRTDFTQFEELIRIVGAPEAVRLEETFDPAAIRQVKEIRTSIEEELNTLDQILSGCAAAVRNDYSVVNQRARQ